MTSNYKCNQTPNTFDQVIECRCTAGARDASFISVAGRKGGTSLRTTANVIEYQRLEKDSNVICRFKSEFPFANHIFLTLVILTHHLKMYRWY
jgi:hypothetical protein